MPTIIAPVFFRTGRADRHALFPYFAFQEKGEVFS
ncbi:hypothetical protein SM11_chr2635 [Sinorhizobium meliloti SM11]|uniref:Uncharacterized protein n=1 Tax=Sinorhizobium meliloti (strain SM11) TaxID=707241 RepID=F7X5Q6_SINMM|nr:hypothetical protein SM11_chr2635 [Sinorhizobium meliloti SM11]